MAASTDELLGTVILELLDEPWSIPCECDHKETIRWHRGDGQWVGMWCGPCGPTVMCAAFHDACVAFGGIHCPHGDFETPLITFTPLNEL